MKLKLRLRIDGESNGQPIKGHVCTTVQTHFSPEAVKQMEETFPDADMLNVLAMSALENFARELRTDDATDAVVTALKKMLATEQPEGEAA